MTIFKMTLAATLTAAALSGCVESPDSGGGMTAVGSANDLSGFEGARAGQAEMGIQRIGFSAVRTQGLTTWWFNPDTGACARITTSDGRYSSVTMLPSGDC